MAVIHDFENVSPIAIYFSRAAAGVQELVNRYQAWKAENAVRAELYALSDAELADIGIARYEIAKLDLSKNA